MKILVTGVAGFIGSDLAEHLLSKGHHVVGVDVFNDYYNPKIKEYNIKDFLDHPNFYLHRLDILDYEVMEELFQQEDFDAVIHLAAWAGVLHSVQNPITNVRNNLEGTTVLLELCAKYEVNNFVFASTSSIYGENPTPFSEDMNTDKPLAPYPASKKGAEVLAYAYHKNYGLNVTIFRIFNPIGPRLRPDLLLAKLIRSCEYGTEVELRMSEPEMGRDYTYIGHIFESIDHVLENPFKYEILNMGNSSPVLLSEMVSTVEEVIGKEANKKIVERLPGEMDVTYANIEKARRLIGYNPTTSIKEAVEIYYDWFMKQEDWYKKGEF